MRKEHDSDKLVDWLNDHLERDFPASISPSPGRSRKPVRANIGKPVTRIRQQISVPCQGDPARKAFKFPPITPKPAKLPGWKLESGFEGTPLAQLKNTIPETRGNLRVRHAKTPCFLRRAFPKLELSSRLSSTRQSLGQKNISTGAESRGNSIGTRRDGPVMNFGSADVAAGEGMPHSAGETGGKTALEPVASLNTPLRPPLENSQPRGESSSDHKTDVEESTQLHQSQNKGLGASQAIREPSKSERNGWLKRRRVDFAIFNEDEEEPLFVHTQRTCVNGSDYGRKNERNGSDTYLIDTAQARSTICNHVQAFNEGGQTTPSSGRPVATQPQVIFRDQQSAEQDRQRASRGAEAQSLNFNGKKIDHPRSHFTPKLPLSSDSKAKVSSSPSYARGFLIPKRRHQIQITRTSEVPETQERPRESETVYTRTRSLDLGRYPPHVSETILDSGKYFSKAVQQLVSLEKLEHTITRGRSRREPDQDARGSEMMLGMQKGAHQLNVAPITGEERPEKQNGSLEFGITPRLKRTVSTVSFRPPFKETW